MPGARRHYQSGAGSTGIPQGCQFFLDPNIPKTGNIYPMTTNYTKRPSNIPNGHKIYQHFPFQGPPKFTQTGIFGLKINHLATLATHS
jgi:hypothetical protein